MTLRQPTLPVRLVEPSIEWEAAWTALEADFRQAGQQPLRNERLRGLPFAEMIARLEGYARGRDLPEGWVPASAFWLASAAGDILGEIDIRHRLTPALENFGGHIGYWVRPSARRQGHATRMLALATEKARALGLRRLLITCDPANTASVRVIERNGGARTTGTVSPTGRPTLRYWIEL